MWRRGSLCSSREDMQSSGKDEFVVRGDGLFCPMLSYFRQSRHIEMDLDVDTIRPLA